MNIIIQATTSLTITDTQIEAPRKEAGKSTILVHGSGLQHGQNVTIIGVVHQKSTQKTEEW